MFIKVNLQWNVMIPAKDMDTNGLMLQRAIAIRLLDAFASKKATKDLGYFLTVTKLENIGEGKIQEHTGAIVFPVVFSGINFKLFKGEVLHGVVHKVVNLGVFLSCGPCENIYLSHIKMPGYNYIPGENPSFVNQNMPRIQIGTTVRFIVINTKWNEGDREFRVLASIKGDKLGPFQRL